MPNVLDEHAVGKGRDVGNERPLDAVGGQAISV